MAATPFFFNGIDGTAGTYLERPRTPTELVRAIVDPGRYHQEDQRHQEDLKYRAAGPLRRVMPGVNPKKLSEAGWGVIFAFEDRDQVPALREALGDLLALRHSQAGDRYREFLGADGYRPNETKAQFLERHGMGPGPANPEKVPYYLLIVGDPRKIPYRFQYQLDVQYAVGRIFFDSLEKYASYARSVVMAETGQVRLPRQVTFFATQHADDRATQLSARELVAPLVDWTARSQSAWQVERISAEQATKQQLANLLGRQAAPALLFTASHGMGFDPNDQRQVRHQGALLCQEWPGPSQWREPIPQDFYLASDDIDDNAAVLGQIAFLSACYGAGTPHRDDFTSGSYIEPREIASFPFVARLPQRLLGHPRGGALAVVSHVERLWSTSFSWGSAGSQLGPYQAYLQHLMEGAPVGYAIEIFNDRYAELATMLGEEMEKLRIARRIYRPDELELSLLWIAHNDARSYVIIGDPAVRPPPGPASSADSTRPAIDLSQPSPIKHPVPLLPSLQEASEPPEEVTYEAIGEALAQLGADVDRILARAASEATDPQLRNTLAVLAEQLQGLFSQAANDVASTSPASASQAPAEARRLAAILRDLSDKAA